MRESGVTETLSSGEAATSPIRIFGRGTSIGERYEVRGVLGTGGSSVVYAVLDRELGREVALKMLRSDRLGETALKRLRREVTIAREARSERLVRVFDIGRSGEDVYLTMEAVPGGSLRGLLARGPLAIEEALRIATMVLEALGDLHAVHVVHRDVKPANVLLCEDGSVKLTDFGLARSWEGEESRATASEALVGTLEYLSPEQATGRELDARSDLYAFGVLLYEMLAGEVPHRRGSQLGTVVARLQKRAPDVRRRRPETPAWLASVVSRLLEVEPEHRYGSASEALVDLRRRAARRSRRSARALALGAGALFSLALGAAVAWSRRAEPELPRFTSNAEGTLRAVDAEGHLLWARPDLLGYRVAWIRRAGREPLLAAVLAPAMEFGRDALHTLSILDPRTGRPVRQTRLPGAGGSYPTFVDRYTPASLRAADVGGDGDEELFLSYVHHPYWPSYTVLYEAGVDLGRVIFTGSGHHLVKGFADLDGDGRLEVILAGPNNRMGWYTGVAAVRVPEAGVPGGGTPPREAGTPDEQAWSPHESLVWYALVTRGSLAASVEVDGPRRQVRVSQGPGAVVTLDANGFDHRSRSPLPARERQASRVAAYRRLQTAASRLAAGAPDRAVEEAGEAERHAGAAGDAVLGEWALRQKARFLCAGGRLEEAEDVWERLVAGSSSAADVAREAGTFLHLAGELGRAARWHRKALEAIQGGEISRPIVDFLQGLVLVLVEAGSLDEAAETLARFQETATAGAAGSLLLQYVRWRGGAVGVDPSPVRLDSPDGVTHYWSLELQAAALTAPSGAGVAADAAGMKAPDGAGVAADAAALLAKADGIVDDVDVAAPLLSLKSVLQGRLGRREAALESARVAQRRAAEELGTSTLARAHYDLVMERLALALEGVSRRDEAREVRAALARWVARRRV